MTPERYQQIDQIFQAALGLEPEPRAAYLDEVCSGDDKLRQEVDSLITSDQGGLSFIDEPAFEMAARVLASDEPALAAEITSAVIGGFVARLRRHGRSLSGSRREAGPQDSPQAPAFSLHHK